MDIFAVTYQDRTLFVTVWDRSYRVPLDPKQRRKPWPSHAKEARDRASEAAVDGIRALDPLVDGKEMGEAEQVRRIGKAHSLFHLIARILENVGAQTEP